MNVVFDTNILISATLWDISVSQKLLLKLIELKINIFSSTEILDEFKKVLKRDFDIYTNKELEDIMKKVISFLILIEPKDKIDIVKEDHDDNKIIECAIASNSAYIITYDKHLLKLDKFRNIKIIKPEEFLNII